MHLNCRRGQTSWALTSDFRWQQGASLPALSPPPPQIQVVGSYYSLSFPFLSSYHGVGAREQISCFGRSIYKCSWELHFENEFHLPKNKMKSTGSCWVLQRLVSCWYILLLSEWQKEGPPRLAFKSSLQMTASPGWCRCSEAGEESHCQWPMKTLNWRLVRKTGQANPCSGLAPGTAPDMPKFGWSLLGLLKTRPPLCISKLTLSEEKMRFQVHDVIKIALGRTQRAWF